MLLLIDSYDSFAHNLAHLLARVWQEPTVLRPDAVRVEDLAGSGAEALVLSPGPGRPGEGLLPELLRACLGRLPILGVCLGHQALGEHFGLPLVRAPRPVHGHARPLRHGGGGLFTGLPPGFAVARYHSLVLDCGPLDELPVELRPGLWIDAACEDGTAMALRCEELGCWGLQFHPESFLCEQGMALAAAFRREAERWRAKSEGPRESLPRRSESASLGTVCQAAGKS
jgi:para-aminobenzoate synthetase component II